MKTNDYNYDVFKTCFIVVSLNFIEKTCSWFSSTIETDGSVLTDIDENRVSEKLYRNVFIFNTCNLYLNI